MFASLHNLQVCILQRVKGCVKRINKTKCVLATVLISLYVLFPILTDQTGMTQFCQSYGIAIKLIVA